jgi:hypothetical protein
VASVDLEQWLDSTERRQVDVVRALDVSKQLVSFWVTGRGVPGLELAEALQRFTGGAVKVMDWREPAAMADQGGAPSASTGAIRLKARALLTKLQKRAKAKTRSARRTSPRSTRSATSRPPSTPSTPATPTVRR